MFDSFQGDLKDPIHARDHQRGNPSAKVKIVLYLDFADPETVRLQKSLDQLMQSSADDVLIVYRHFPQTTRNVQAFAVAQALEAAAKQDQFWEMLDQILAHQDQLTDGFLRQYARAIDLDKAQFEDDFSHTDTLQRIRHDMQRASDSTIEQAPAIFINGLRQHGISLRFIHELIASGGDVSG
ncbi:MAG: DsbA family protein [Anaerolineae bacterium]